MGQRLQECILSLPVSAALAQQIAEAIQAIYQPALVWTGWPSMLHGPHGDRNCGPEFSSVCKAGRFGHDSQSTVAVEACR